MCYLHLRISFSSFLISQFTFLAPFDYCTKAYIYFLPCYIFFLYYLQLSQSSSFSLFFNYSFYFFICSFFFSCSLIFLFSPYKCFIIQAVFSFLSVFELFEMSFLLLSFNRSVVGTKSNVFSLFLDIIDVELLLSLLLSELAFLLSEREISAGGNLCVKRAQ